MNHAADSRLTDLVGQPSDEVGDILATGHRTVSTLFVSMSERHPDGADADYLRWHSLDHRPEQYRLASVQSALRVVSTPACRAVRAASEGRYDAIDHVMTYFFAEQAGLEDFGQLSRALAGAGRVPFVLMPVQRGVYTVAERIAAARAKAGADVLPWRPARGVYLLLEEGGDAATELVDIAGVAGVWSADSTPSAFADAGEGQRLTYCFLDDEPVATAERLLPVLQQRWRQGGIRPLLAAPFHTIVPYEWDRYLP